MYCMMRNVSVNVNGRVVETVPPLKRYVKHILQCKVVKLQRPIYPPAATMEGSKSGIDVSWMRFKNVLSDRVSIKS